MVCSRPLAYGVLSILDRLPLAVQGEEKSGRPVRLSSRHVKASSATGSRYACTTDGEFPSLFAMPASFTSLKCLAQQPNSHVGRCGSSWAAGWRRRASTEAHRGKSSRRPDGVSSEIAVRLLVCVRLSL